MKLRGGLIKPAAFGLSCVLKAWLGTLRFRLRELVPGVAPTTKGLRERFIYVFWHEGLLLPAKAFAHLPLHVLISEHADGELIAQVMKHLGIRSVRGSTTRGGTAALHEMTELASRSHLAFTPDGPRGPRRVMQPGAVALARLTGLRIVPAGFAFHRCWRARSWDRFAIPYPFSPAVCVAGAPISVPRRLDRGGMERCRQQAENALHDVTERAEAWAAEESW